MITTFEIDVTPTTTSEFIIELGDGAEWKFGLLHRLRHVDGHVVSVPRTFTPTSDDLFDRLEEEIANDSLQGAAGVTYDLQSTVVDRVLEALLDGPKWSPA
ncbi:MAG: hypothetical protein ACTHU1_12995 [Arachnia sp.]